MRARGYGYCPPWCADRDYEGSDDHPAIHTGPLFGIQALAPWGGEVTVFMQPIADYVRGLPDDTSTVNMGSPRIMLAYGDQPPLFWLPPANARSTAAALLRMADQLETGPTATP